MTEAIGIVHSCFREKFGIPRQPGLVSEARGQIELYSPWNRPEAVRELDRFSHIWVIFGFHAVAVDAELRLTVRPPRLGGNQRIGVFASRSPFRPNQLGLSVMRLESIRASDNGLFLQVSGLDILDGTPVFDIKPYVPYSDCVTEATSSLATAAPQPIAEIDFEPQAEKQCLEQESRWPGLQALIRAVLAQDPRPAYKQGQDGVYGMKLYDLNICWRVDQGAVRVTDISLLA